MAQSGSWLHRKSTGLGRGALRLANSFRSEQTGVTAVETALVAAPFFAILIAAMQLGLVYLTQAALEVATEKTARSVLTGADQIAGLTQQQFVSALCQNAPIIISCSSLMVDAQVYNNFSNSNTKAPAITYDSSGHVTNQWSYNLGGANSIVVLRVMYLMPVVGAFAFNVSNTGTNMRLLMATAVFKNEPYQ